MSEPIWCNARFKVPKSWGDQPPPFVKDLAEVGLMNGSGPELYSRDDDTIVWEVDGEGNYGWYDDDARLALEFCERHRIPYRATEDPKYEMPGEIHVYDGTKTWDRTGDGNGNVILADFQWQGIKAGKDGPTAIIAALDEYFVLPDLEDIDISHLPAWCPQDEEEEVDA